MSLMSNDIILCVMQWYSILNDYNDISDKYDIFCNILTVNVLMANVIQ